MIDFAMNTQKKVIDLVEEQQVNRFSNREKSISFEEFILPGKFIDEAVSLKKISPYLIEKVEQKYFIDRKELSPFFP